MHARIRWRRDNPAARGCNGCRCAARWPKQPGKRIGCAVVGRIANALCARGNRNAFRDCACALRRPAVRTRAGAIAPRQMRVVVDRPVALDTDVRRQAPCAVTRRRVWVIDDGQDRHGVCFRRRQTTMASSGAPRRSRCCLALDIASLRMMRAVGLPSRRCQRSVAPSCRVADARVCGHARDAAVTSVGGPTRCTRRRRLRPFVTQSSARLQTFVGRVPELFCLRNSSTPGVKRCACGDCLAFVEGVFSVTKERCVLL